MEGATRYVMEPTAFAQQQHWHGSSYELAISYATTATDSLLLAAIRAAWTVPVLDGPYAGSAYIGQALAVPTALEPDGETGAFGVLHLAVDKPVGCVAVVSCAEQGFRLSIPAGMLERVYDVQYPLTLSANPWLEQVDRCLLGIAQTIHIAAPFDVAAIEEEASGVFFDRVAVTAERIGHGGFLVSSDLVARLHVQNAGQTLSGGLCWYARQDETSG